VIVRVRGRGPFARPVEPFEPAFCPPSSPRLAALRRGYRLADVAGEGADFDRCRRIMNWVRSRWNHGYDSIPDRSDALGLLAAAARGLRFQCSDYATLFVQCCLALGLPARRLGIRRKETDFPHGYLGNHGHSVAEAYCREPAKWVLFDADLNCHYTIAGAPAGALDLHRSWHEHRGRNVAQVLDEPRFVPILQCPGISERQMRKNWRDFSRHRTIDYYFYLTAALAHGYARTDPPPERRGTLFFAGIVPPPLAVNFRQARPDHVLVTREDQFNWPIDRTFILASMLGAKPSRRVEVRLQHTMPFFDRFELAVGRGSFRRLRGDAAVLSVPDGLTTVRARCVDGFGRPGHEATVKIETRTVAAAPPK